MTNEEDGNDVIEQKPQYTQKSRVVYVKSKSKLRIYYLVTYLLTYSMEQSPSWEANWFCS